MPTPVKYLLFIFSFIIVVIVGLVVLVQTQVTSEKLRQHLLPVAEDALQRKIEFGDIEIGLFSGVTIADLKVKQKESEDDFVSVKLLKLHYRLWSLLRGKVEIDQVFLEQPQILVTRSSNGQFNFHDLAVSSNGGNVSRIEKKQNLSVSEMPLRLLVKEVKISDGLIHFTDRYRNERTPYRYRLEQLNLDARKITLDELFPIDLSVKLNDTQIDISGHYNIAAQSGDLLIQTAPLNLVQFAPYFRDLIPFKIGSAILSTNLEIDVQPQTLASKGKIDFKELDITATENSQIQFKNASLATDYSLSYDFDKKILELSTLLIDFNDLRAGIEGQVDLSQADPSLSSTLTLDQIDLRKVMQVIPVSLIREYQKYSLAGIVSGRFSLVGAVSNGRNLLQHASISLQDVQVSAKNIRAGVSGNLDYRDNVVTANDIALKYGELEANLNLKIEDILEPVPRAEFKLSAATLDLNSLMPDQPQGSQPSATSGNGPVEVTQERVAEEIGPFFIGADISGKINADKIIYKQLQMDQFVADVALRNNKLSLTNVRTKVADGQMVAAAVIDLGIRGLAYQGQMNVVQPDVVTLVSGLLPQSSQSVSGQLSWQNNFSGRGTNPDSLFDHLQLSGEYNLGNGIIEGAPVLDSLATFLGYSDLKILSFNSLAGQYRLDDGLFNLLGDLKSSKVELTPEGSVDALGRLKLKLNTRLAPELISKLRTRNSLKQIITDQHGWGILPLEIGGTLDRPKVSFDTGALQQQTLDKAKEQITDKLLKEIPAAEGDQEPIRQMLDNTLNKLFGN